MLRIAAITFSALLVLGACGSDDDGDDPSADARTDQLVEELGIPQESAQCLADSLSSDETLRLTEGGEPSDALIEEFVDAFDDCDLAITDVFELDTEAGDTTTDSSPTPESTTTTSSSETTTTVS